MDQKSEIKAKETHTHFGDMKLTGLDGKPVLLKELAGDAGVAVGFLHGTYCPACMQQLTRANRYATALAEHHIKLVWLLQDKPASISAYELAASPSPRYRLLADTEPSAAQQFQKPGESGEDAVEPALVFLNSDGVLRYTEIPENPHAPLHIEELIKAVETEQASKADKA